MTTIAKTIAFALLLALLPINLATQTAIPPTLPWPTNLPTYDHIIIVIEENKNYEQIIGSPAAPYINDVLKKEGATLTRIYAEEHHSQGNYFWLFSGSNQQVGFRDQVPQSSFNTSNLGEELIRTAHSFKAYSEDLPQIGSTVVSQGHYARKHCPWVSFSNIPNGSTVAGSSNLRFPQDFPTDFSHLPTVAFVIPNLIDDMHDGALTPSITAGDAWLKKNLDAYYQWAKSHNSLLILTFDESDQSPLIGGLTDPADKNPANRNRIATILAGAHIRPGEYPEAQGVTHVNILRTLEAMYKLNKSGAQSPNAVNAGISDNFTVRDIFTAPN